MILVCVLIPFVLLQCNVYTVNPEKNYCHITRIYYRGNLAAGMMQL